MAGERIQIGVAGGLRLPKNAAPPPRSTRADKFLGRIAAGLKQSVSAAETAGYPMPVGSRNVADADDAQHAFNGWKTLEPLRGRSDMLG
jgi:hypothetical protein